MVYEDKKKFEADQDIDFKDHKPFLKNVNDIIKELYVLGVEMHEDPSKMFKYHNCLKSLIPICSKFIVNKEVLEKKLVKLKEFLNCKIFNKELEEIVKGRREHFSQSIRRDIRRCREELFKIAGIISSYFSDEGVIPNPKKREKEIWEEENSKSLRERQKAICDLIMSGG